MNIQEMKAEHRAKVKEARALMAKITDSTPAKEARQIEREFDATLAEADALRGQIEDAQEAQHRGDPRRPVGADAEVRGDGITLAPGEKSFALGKEDRMTA